MKSLRGEGLLKLLTSAKSDESSFPSFILRANASAGTVVRTNFSSNRTEGRRCPRAASASLSAAIASSSAPRTNALFDSARATAWEKSTDSIADAAGWCGKTGVRRSSAATDRAEREGHRASRFILVSLAQCATICCIGCNGHGYHGETAHCVPFMIPNLRKYRHPWIWNQGEPAGHRPPVPLSTPCGYKWKRGCIRGCSPFRRSLPPCAA
ncbi:MAG: hypothetical protein H6Q81_2442 [Deltaproteobacteria bacterium]|nr:hypothetical protein [Deltaproteobacteria bacterium]